jgi:flagellar basal body P-ring formation protein FlgA
MMRTTTTIAALLANRYATTRVCAALALLLMVVAPIAPATAAWQTPGTPTSVIAVAQAIPPVGITTTVNPSYFNITADDVSKAIAEQLQLQAVEKKADVSLIAGTPSILYSADHPLKISIHALQIDTQSRRWQAQAYILAAGKTETVKPVSGSYIPLVDVPVLKRQLAKTDVIEEKDLGSKAIPDRFVRKDTVTDAKLLIGQSPRSIISADRPIRQGEISSPILIKKGQSVQLTYTNPYMSLKATGVALQDGAAGDMIRVKNDKSEKAVGGRVVANGRVEVNTTPAL